MQAELLELETANVMLRTELGYLARGEPGASAVDVEELAQSDYVRQGWSQCKDTFVLYIPV